MVERQLEINAPIEVVFQVVQDLKSYPDFLPTTKSVKVKKTTANGCDATFKIEIIKPIEYTLRFKWQPPQKLEWTFVDGDMMKSNDGSWTLSEISPKKTRVQYAIDVGFGWLVPKMIVDQLTKSQLPEMLSAFKKRAEDLYRNQKKES